MARPVGVTILGVLVIIVAILIALLGLFLIAVGLAAAAVVPGAGILGSAAVVAGLIVLVFAIILGVAGSGLLKLRPWAWWLATFVVFAYLAWTGYGIYSSGVVDAGSVFSALILLVLFVYMLSVRKYFRPGAYPA